MGAVPHHFFRLLAAGYSPTWPIFHHTAHFTLRMLPGQAQHALGMPRASDAIFLHAAPRRRERPRNTLEGQAMLEEFQAPLSPNASQKDARCKRLHDFAQAVEIYN